MTAVISTTKDDLYFFYMPIVAWAWSKNGINTRCFIVDEDTIGVMCSDKMKLVNEWVEKLKLQWYFKEYYITAPPEKCATYAQCARLFSAPIIDQSELIISSDIDMCAFFIPNKLAFDPNGFLVLGGDLTENDQFPMCYMVASQPVWKRVFCPISQLTPQDYLDDLVGKIECTDFRGNQWCLDQFTAKKTIVSSGVHVTVGSRRSPHGFAEHRVDRDDINYLEAARSKPIDYHMHRPGYLNENTIKIVDVLNTVIGGADWIYDYTEQYRKIIA